jgi:hypothetical protein
VIRLDTDSVSRSFKVVAPHLEALRDRREFFIEYIVSDLCIREAFRMVCHRVPVLLGRLRTIGLQEYSALCRIGGIYDYHNGLCGIKVFQQRCTYESVAKSIE